VGKNRGSPGPDRFAGVFSGSRPGESLPKTVPSDFAASQPTERFLNSANGQSLAPTLG